MNRLWVDCELTVNWLWQFQLSMKRWYLPAWFREVRLNSYSHHRKTSLLLPMVKEWILELTRKHQMAFGQILVLFGYVSLVGVTVCWDHVLCQSGASIPGAIDVLMLVPCDVVPHVLRADCHVWYFPRISKWVYAHTWCGLTVHSQSTHSRLTVNSQSTHVNNI